MREKSVSFEKSIERLDAIVRSLEQGNVPLEQALKLFQEGTGLVKTCDEMLSGASGREADEGRRRRTGRNGVYER